VARCDWLACSESRFADSIIIAGACAPGNCGGDGSRKARLADTEGKGIMVQNEWMTLARDEAAIWWFDRETRRLVSVPTRDWEQVSQLPADASPAIQGAAVSLASQIRGHPARYQRIPLSAEQELVDAQAFVPTVLSSVVQRNLEGVLVGSRAMDRFRTLLARHPDELARWQLFRAARLQTRIREWLREEGLY